MLKVMSNNCIQNRVGLRLCDVGNSLACQSLSLSIIFLFSEKNILILIKISDTQEGNTNKPCQCTFYFSNAILCDGHLSLSKYNGTNLHQIIIVRYFCCWLSGHRTSSTYNSHLCRRIQQSSMEGIKCSSMFTL